MAASAAIRGGFQRTADKIGLVWNNIWFQDGPTTPLEISRIGIGIALLLHYILATPYLLIFWGDDGWMPRTLLAQEHSDPWAQSILFYLTAPWQLYLFHTLFLACCVAFTLGWRTSWVKWAVLAGQLSYDNRNPDMYYGVDSILACLLLILCFAPIGRALSLDRVRQVRAAKLVDLRAHPRRFSSRWAFACTRLMQIQMAILFLYSAVGKLRGEQWWHGEAVWRVFSSADYYNEFMLRIFAPNFWLVNIATYAVILIELAFPFMVWQRRSRPYLLAGAAFLHLQFALLMNLFYFSFVMVMGHMSFLFPDWLQGLGAMWKWRIGPMEMIYDGHCGFCKRSMAGFLAFDGLRQIQIRDFRTNPSDVVSDEQMKKALYLVLPDKRALPGFEAYRYVVLRVPGLWWLIPFFYIPVFSRLLGHPIYNWIAVNRSRL